MASDGTSVDLKLECATVLGSLANGCDENVRMIVEAGSIPLLLKGCTALLVLL